MVTQFATQFYSKNLTYFEPQLTVKNILLQLSQKTTYFTKNVLVGVRKKHLHCTFSRRPRTAFSKYWESKCRCIPVCLHKKLLSGGGPNNFLKEARCLGLVKCFKIFHLNRNFGKFNYISAF